MMKPDEIQLSAVSNSPIAEIHCGQAAFDRLRNAIREAAPECEANWDSFRAFRIVDVSEIEPHRAPGRFDRLITAGCFLALLAITATFIAGLFTVAADLAELLRSAFS